MRHPLMNAKGETTKAVSTCLGRSSSLSERPSGACTSKPTFQIFRDKTMDEFSAEKISLVLSTSILVSSGSYRTVQFQRTIVTEGALDSNRNL
eukprot:m.456156 g.456156  ORF g.456156 m.456156 type:complete len:93 (-) comp20999_c0_seq1:10-288(-)